MTSFQQLFNFTADHLQGAYVKILSVFKNKLLLGGEDFSQLFIYSNEGVYLSNITTTDDNITLWDATWTPSGNIVYTKFNCGELVVMTESAEIIIKHTQMTKPWYFSVSDDIIYLTDLDEGVYQSTDDGISWSLVFKTTAGWDCEHVIKAITDLSDDYWTLESDDKYKRHLSVYSVDRRLSNGNVTWRNINLPKTNGKNIELFNSRLSLDSSMNIFLSDLDNKAVHVFSANGKYHRQLLSSKHIKDKPTRIAVDKERQLLYVGQQSGVVEVFTLTYGDWD